MEVDGWLTRNKSLALRVTTTELVRELNTKTPVGSSHSFQNGWDAGFRSINTLSTGSKGSRGYDGKRDFGSTFSELLSNVFSCTAILNAFLNP